MQDVNLLYVADGHFDSGHYDLALPARDAHWEAVEDEYAEWRHKKIFELLGSDITETDLSHYGAFFADNCGGTLRRRSGSIRTIVKQKPNLVRIWIVREAKFVFGVMLFRRFAL